MAAETTAPMTSGALLLLISKSCCSLFVPLGVVSAVLVLAGVAPVTFNEQATYGMTGFLVALLLYAVLLPVGAILLISMVLLPGMWLYRLFSALARKVFPSTAQSTRANQ